MRGESRPPDWEGWGGTGALAELAAGLSRLTVAMVSVQAAAGSLLQDLMEALPERDPGPAGRPGEVRYLPGPPRLLHFVFYEGPPRIEVHWGTYPGAASYAEVRDRWRRVVAATLEEARRRGMPLPTSPFGPSAAFFTFHFASSRVRDVDNYSTRFILNALRHHGILRDDNFDCLSLAVRGFSDGPLRTELTLVEGIELPFRALEEPGPLRQVLEEMQAEVARACSQAG